LARQASWHGGTKNSGQMHPDVDDLASVLFGLDCRSLTTKAVTARITREILAWAVSRGWSARTEARVAPGLESGDKAQLGFLDVVVRRDGGLPDFAIEIDSFHKPWSLDKLRHAAAGGMHAVWIRWGDDVWAGVYDQVDVIQLYTNRLSASRRMTRDQLELRI
jgi:hypothetical protein